MSNKSKIPYDKKAAENIRMAKFKKIDWEAVHSNIFKGPSKRMIKESTSMKPLGHGNSSPTAATEAPLFVNEASVKWIEQLPKLRKNI